MEGETSCGGNRLASPQAESIRPRSNSAIRYCSTSNHQRISVPSCNGMAKAIVVPIAEVFAAISAPNLGELTIGWIDAPVVTH